ncbi:MAG: hypothetical protein AAF191_02650 [Verrucomicrobiota bacterium]
MKALSDSWFVLQHSAYPWWTGGLFFLLGVWFGYLQWHRWAHHFAVLRSERAKLQKELAEMEQTREAQPGSGAASSDDPERLLLPEPSDSEVKPRRLDTAIAAWKSMEKNPPASSS